MWLCHFTFPLAISVSVSSLYSPRIWWCQCSDLRHSTGEGNGNPLQRSCLENPRDGGAWWAALGSHRVGHELYLIGVLIFISLRTYDVEHLFRCLFSICISFFGYIFVKVFGSFFNEFFFFFLSYFGILRFLSVLHQCAFCKYFSPSLWHWALQRRNFNINKFQLINYLFHGSHLWYLRRHCHAQGHLQFLLCCLLGVYSFAFLHLYLGSCVHFLKHVKSFIFCRWMPSCFSIIY